jgi:hypothetical protein
MNAFARTLALGVAGRAQMAAAVAVFAGASFGAAETAQAGIVRDPYSVWDPYARAQGQSYLVGGTALQGGAAVHLRITGGIGTRNTSAFCLGNYYDPVQGGMRSLYMTAQHNISDFDGGPSVSSIRTGTNYNSDPGQVIGVHRWIIGNMSAPRDPGMRDYAFFWGDTTLAGNNIVLGQATAGDILAVVGNGRTGSEGTGDLGRDGYMRAVYSLMDSQVDSPFNPAIYSQALSNSVYQIQGLGRSRSGYSGGLVANQNGEVVGMQLAGTNGWTLNGANYLYNFPSDPVWLEQFNSLTVPSPASLGLLGLGAVVAGSRRRR